ncbi:Derlin [Mycena sanguinolenta]|uniref:Derlin n=1 Tax=Mycena sanguinolenta TaxID=230812 RepID=A0A8H6ZFW0_9AGAR|nr:Derlin [Mycena sanguinolenta]
MNALVAGIRETPPVTRLILASTLTVSLSCWMTVVFPGTFAYSYYLVFEKREFWRLYTSFFYASSLEPPFIFRRVIPLILELVVLYRIMVELESGPHTPYAGKSTHLAWQLVVAGAAILLLSIPMAPRFFFRPFSVCLTYISTALAGPGILTQLSDIEISITATPYIMLFIDLLSGGPHAVIRALPGVVVGHMWWLMKTYFGKQNRNTRPVVGRADAKMGRPPRAQTELTESRDGSESAATTTAYNRARGGKKCGGG